MTTLTYHNVTTYQSNRSAGLIARVARVVELWHSRIIERHAFDFVDDRELVDLGLSRWEVERELRKPFWRG